MTTLTTANQLTLFRMFLIPAFVIFVVVRPGRAGRWSPSWSRGSPTASTA